MVGGIVKKPGAICAWLFDSNSSIIIISVRLLLGLQVRFVIFTFVAILLNEPDMTIKNCKFRIGDVYLFHDTDPECQSRTALWGIVDKRSAEGRIHMEVFTPNLKNYRFWTLLPEKYRFCRLATREELRDFSFSLNRI